MRLLFGLLLCCRPVPVGHRLDEPLFQPSALPPCVPSTDTFCGEESSAVLDNPHQGFTSFHTTASQLPSDKHPRARVAYARYWWNELEPVAGEIDFAAIDAAIAAADADGQTFAFRVMPEESAEGAQRIPAWLAQSAGGTWGRQGGGPRYLSPNYDSPAFIIAAERTIAALGARYDGDPRVEHVDVGFVGDSGEWADVVDGATMPSVASVNSILDAFANAFKKTPVLMLVGAVDDGAQPLAAGLMRGFGWRLDCWGDIRAGWNHHDDFYEQRLEAAQALNVWKQHPVAVETCGEMEAWETLGFDTGQVRWLLRWALDHHVVLINNKSRPVPRQWRALVDEYLSYAGPRFFVRQATRSGATLQVSLMNRGSTPPYHDWRLAVRAGSGAVVTSGASLSLVHDGLDLTFELPAGADAELALFDERGRVIALANANTQDDGWLRVFPR